MNAVKKIVIGTRNSRLAITQAEHVKNLIDRLGVATEIKSFSSQGDRDLLTPLYQSSDRGVFTKDLEDRLLRKEVDLVVHCLKDLPTTEVPGTKVVAVLERDPWQDLLVLGNHVVCNKISSVKDLPAGFRIGSSSLRRKAWVLHQNPTITVNNIRGNVHTRIEKLRAGEFDGIIIAKAAITRMNWLLEEKMIELGSLPAPAQGALAIQVRDEDHELRSILKPINCEKTQAACVLERKLLHLLQGGCSLPLGALSDGKSLDYWLWDKDVLRAGVSREFSWGAAHGAFWQIQQQRKFLDGVKIISSRPRGEEDVCESVLLNAGAIVLRKPLLELKSLPWQEKWKIGPGDLVVISSPKTPPILAAHMTDLKDQRIAVVGEGTARAVRKYLKTEPQIIADGSMDSLECCISGEKNIVQIGHLRGQLLSGAHVRVFSVYDMIPTVFSSETWSEPHEIPVIVSSPESAELLRKVQNPRPAYVLGEKTRRILDGWCEIKAWSKSIEELAWKICQSVQGA